MENEIRIAARILFLLAEKQCSIAEWEAISNIVSNKMKNSATLQCSYYEQFESDLRKEITRQIPPRLQQT